MPRQPKQATPAPPPRPADGLAAAGLSRLKALYGFMTENGLDTVEIDEPGLKMRLVRRAAAAPVPVPVFAPGALPAGAPAGAVPAAEPAGPPDGCAAVKSSMMGIFYRAPSPSSPPFVKEGDSVKPGQVLCIIEAMKVFNELKAEFPGVVVRVLAENGKPIKAGQDAFWIRRA